MTDASPPDRPGPAKPSRRPPERAEVPTLNGGAYFLAYYGPGDRIAEIVEFDAADREIRRTYCAGNRAFEPLRSRDEDLGTGGPPSLVGLISMGTDEARGKARAGSVEDWSTESLLAAR